MELGPTKTTEKNFTTNNYLNVNNSAVPQVSLPSVTVQDIDAMNASDGTTTPNHEHTIESGQIALADFRGPIVTAVRPQPVVPEQSQVR